MYVIKGTRIIYSYNHSSIYIFFFLDDVREVLRQLSVLIQKVNDISSEVKSLREELTKANIIP